jgi:hypothetical protein
MTMQLWQALVMMLHDKFQPPQFEQGGCKRCGNAVELQTVIAKFGDRNAFGIFRCLSCNATEWRPTEDARNT